jgi:hypothetical protein
MMVPRQLKSRGLIGNTVRTIQKGLNRGCPIWVWVLLVFRDQPVLLGTPLLAYTFGLRYAVDADHIAAIR